MAIQTIYLLGTAATAPNWFGNTQLNGTAPTAANSAFGWVPAKTAVTTPYYRGRLGATTTSGTAAQAASYNASTSGPTPGTGSGATTAGDCFVVGPFAGTFAAGSWNFNFNLRASTAGAVGNLNMRVWRGTNPSGAGATSVFANSPQSNRTLSTTVDQNSGSIVTATAFGSLTYNNEYLFIQLEWQETTAGTSNSNNVFFRIGTATIVTTDFVPIADGDLALSQAAQTVAAAGGPRVAGTLTATQAEQTVSATGAPAAVGTLALTEISDTLVAAGGPRVSGTLALTKQSDTLTAAGTVVTAGAAPTFSLVAHAEASNASTPGVNTTGAHLLVAQFSHYQSQNRPTSVTDNYGNVWTQLGITQTDDEPSAAVSTWYALRGLTVGPGHSVSWGGSLPSATRIQFSAWSSSTGSFYSPQEFASAGGVTPISGRPTVTATNFLVITGAATADSSNPTGAGSGWTTINLMTFVPGTNFGTGNAYYTGTGATADAIWANDVGTASTAYNLFSFTPTSAYTGNLTLAFTPGGDRNDYTIKVGVQFTATTGQTYDRIGVRKATDNTGLHSVSLYDSGGTQLRQANVDLTGGLVGNFYYATITPITLTNGASYYLAADQTGGGQFWSDAGPTTLSAGVTAISAAYYLSSWVAGNDFDKQFVGVDLALVAAAPSDITGTLALTEVSDTLAATGTVASAPATGTLSVNQAAQTIVAAGGPRVGGTLSVTEISDTLVAAGGPRVGGTLTANQAAQTVVAAAGPVVGGTLTATEALDTIVAAGSVIVRGTLTANQAQTIAATGGPVVAGILGGVSDTYTVLLLHCDGSDGSTIFTDATGLHGSATIVGAAKVATADSVFGGASLLLDGVSAALRFADSPDFNLTGDFTIDLRFNSTASAAARNISGQCSSTNTNISFFIRLASTNNIVVAVSPNGLAANLTSINGTTTFSTPTGWHHLAFVRSGDVLKLFIDGVQEGGDVAFTGPVFDSPNNLAIGTQGERTATPFPGYIDEFRISSVARWTANFTPPTAAYNLSSQGITQAAQTLVAVGGPRVGGTLSATEALDTISAFAFLPATGTLAVTETTDTIAATGVVGVVTDVVLLCHFDNAPFVDVSTYHHTLTATNVTVSTPNPKFGAGCAYWTFGSPNANIDTGSASDFWFDAGPFTIEAWIYANSNPTGDTYNPILAQWDAVLGNVGFFFNVFPHMMFFCSPDGTTYDYVDTATTPSQNAWHHVAVDRDASNVVRLYLDGAVVGSKTIAFSIFHSTYHALIGNDASLGRAFPGALDEVRVVRGTAMYQGAFTPPTAPYPPAEVVVGITATLNVTETPDAVAATGTVAVSGTLITNQAAQTIVAAGGPRVGGTLTAIEALDTIVAAGGPRVGGTLTANQTAQTITATGTVLSGVSGNLTSPQASQTLAATGTFPWVANLNVTQAVQTIAATGGPAVRGTLTANQSAQTIVASGSVVTGTSAALSVIQASQTLVAAGRVPYVGTLAVTEALDTIAATGGPVARGTLTVNETADTLVSAGGPRVDGILAANQAAQTIVATGGPVARGILTANQAAQTIAATGSVLSGISAALNRPQAAQTLAAAGTLGAAGTLSVTEAADTIAATARAVVGATLGVTQANQTLAANAGVRVGATLAVTEALDTINATATVAIRGTLSVTEANDAINATALLPAIGNLHVTQQNQILVATAIVRDRVLPSFPIYGGDTNGRYIVTNIEDRMIASDSNARTLVSSNSNYRTATSSAPRRTLPSARR